MAKDKTTSPSVKKISEHTTEGNPYQIRTDFEDLEIQLCKLLGKQLRLAVQSEDFGAYMSRYKNRFLKQAGSIIKRYLAKAQRDTRSVLNATYEQAMHDEAEKLYDSTSKTKQRKLKVKFGGQNDLKMDALSKELTQSEREAAVSILRTLDDKYKRITADTLKAYAGGHLDLEHAAFKGAKDLAKYGIKAIPYKNGRKVNSVSYVEMAARTANQRAKFYGEGELRQESGNFLVIVSSHLSTCELCAPWQGKILIDDVFSGSVPDEVMAKYGGKYAKVSDAISAKFLHPNCRHQLSTYYVGMSRKRAVQADEETRAKYYNAEVKQRALEREIRAAKRGQALAISPEDKKEAEADLLKAQKAMTDHLKSNPQLREIDWREKVYLK